MLAQTANTSDEKTPNEIDRSCYGKEVGILWPTREGDALIEVLCKKIAKEIDIEVWQDDIRELTWLVGLESYHRAEDKELWRSIVKKWVRQRPHQLQSR